MEGLHSCTIFCNRRGEEWYKVRRVLNMKMLKPKVIGEYAQGFNEVSSDLLSRLKQTRDDEGLIPNIKDELFKWSLECEFITLTPPPPHPLTPTTPLTQHFAFTFLLISPRNSVNTFAQRGNEDNANASVNH